MLLFCALNPTDLREEASSLVNLILGEGESSASLHPVSHLKGCMDI